VVSIVRLAPPLLILAVLLPQAMPAVGLKLIRNFGTEIGGEIRGTFTVKAKAPAAEAVDFYLDDQLVATDSEEPFKWTFKTRDYPDGVHVIRAVAHYGDGAIDEGVLEVHFVSRFGSKMLIVLVIIFLSVSGPVVLAILLAQREKERYQGRTRCPRCGTVFERRWSFLHKGSAYRNKCTMCGHTFWAEAIGEESEDHSESFGP